MISTQGSESVIRTVREDRMALSDEVVTLIEEEEETLRRIVADLESQRTVGLRRLDTEEQRAQDLTSQIVAARPQLRVNQ